MVGMAGASGFSADPGGLTLYLRVTPNAGHDRIEGWETRADGAVVLRVRVKAVPDKGRANSAVMGLVGKALGLRQADISLVAGDTARLKTLHLAGDPALLAERLVALFPQA